MPTQSEEVRRAEGGGRSGEWAARSDTPKRSVFGNYRAEDSRSSGRESAPSSQSRLTSAATNDQATLQTSIDLAIARSFIYRYLAKLFEDPSPEGWQWLCDTGTREVLRSAAAVTAVALPEATFTPDSFDSFLDAHLNAFGHAARGGCPQNEIEYGDIKADPLFQPHRLADLAAFYRAFGLEMSPDASERHDHICIELEFMSVLAAKEAFALEHQLDAEQLSVCRAAQKKFLREHLGRWVPAFARQLLDTVGDGPLATLARFTRAFVEAECARFDVAPGGEDLLLRPVDEAAERMCDSCGLANGLPGALATSEA